MLAPPVLDVTRSVSGRSWLARPCDERLVSAMMQSRGLSEAAARALVGRGVVPDRADSFLEPRLKTLMPDPSVLTDMDVAADRIARALSAGEPIAVFGDYDVDGATSAALLLRIAGALGVPVQLYVPDRMTEGYGPSAEAMRYLAERGARLVVTVDCGTAAHAAVEAAAGLGLDVVVLDHHAPDAGLPAASAVVNPKRIDDTSGLDMLAAVGVTFLALVAVSRRLREIDPALAVRMPDLMTLLDLVALGTVADVVPLTGLNRALVAQGLKVMAQRRNPGIAALLDVAGVAGLPTAYHLGFVLGPRVNAGGRVGRADTGAILLSTGDSAEAYGLAARLNEWNRERQEIEAAHLAEALAQCDAADEGAPVTFAIGEAWHPGVIGLIASRLKDRYNRPALALAVANGEATGSGRSVPGVDLGRIVIAARERGLLTAGGGHAMAAGFRLETARLTAFQAFMTAEIGRALAGALAADALSLDGVIAVAGAGLDLLREIDALAPFGSGNPEPRYALAHAVVVRADIVGQGHVRCILSGPGGGRLKGIAFRAADSDLGVALLNAGDGRSLHLAGYLRRDDWQGREQAQFVIEDAAQVLS